MAWQRPVGRARPHACGAGAGARSWDGAGAGGNVGRGLGPGVMVGGGWGRGNGGRRLGSGAMVLGGVLPSLHLPCPPLPRPPACPPACPANHCRVRLPAPPACLSRLSRPPMPPRPPLPPRLPAPPTNAPPACPAHQSRAGGVAPPAGRLSTPATLRRAVARQLPCRAHLHHQGRSLAPTATTAPDYDHRRAKGVGAGA